MPRTGTSIRATVLAATGLAAAGLSAVDDPARTPDEAATSQPLYSVECETQAEGERVCFVDRDTYVGWRTFHAFCHVCHAQDAVGSSFAPNLLERIAVMDKERFVHVMDNGFTGQVGVMPPWKDNPNVNKHYDALYAYLKARANGDLPPGRPQRRRE